MFQASDGAPVSGPDVSGTGSGFADPVIDSQDAFRGCVAALATPGAVVRIRTGLLPVPPFGPAATALLLALLDQDTRLWLSPGASAGSAAASLKFHTGCSLAAVPGEADFAFVAGVEELPPLESFGADAQDYPERSATVLLQVPELAERGWKLTGPGIRCESGLAVPALGVGFVEQWERNRARFPRGIDLYLVCGEQVCGLPRTTRIEL
jgi:alpha-D-ribose 1-methylphosphonate 5-triphosphate synthase subunit PhnH